MSSYYNPNRKRNLYDENSKELFRLSRSKIDLFISCPRCFYPDRKLVNFRRPGTTATSANTEMQSLTTKNETNEN